MTRTTEQTNGSEKLVPSKNKLRKRENRKKITSTHLIFIVIYLLLAVWGILGITKVLSEGLLSFYIVLVILGGIFAIIWSLPVWRVIFFWWLDKALDKAVMRLGADN